MNPRKQKTFCTKLFFTKLFVFCVIPLLFSCDILRNGLFEVNGWSPGGGYHNPSPSEISLAFSLEPDRNSVENSFSLTENGKNLSGHFSWRGSRMIFTPSSPLPINKDYLVVLKTDAQDSKGLNLERQFEAAFTTRNSAGRPALLDSTPRDGGTIAGEREKVELLFSSPMNRSSLSNLSFSPSVSGVWSLEAGGRKAVFTPSENWNINRAYKLSIGTAVADEAEREMGREALLHFNVGLDKIPPRLVSAFAVDSANQNALTLNADDGTVAENSGWEKDYRLCLVFSEPVDCVSVTSALSCAPSLELIAETAPGYADTLVYRFTEVPRFGDSYTISLENTVQDMAGNVLEEKICWRIRADGEHSKLPALVGIRFPKDPVSYSPLLTYTPKDSFADFPVESKYYSFDTGIDTWIELYFETAAGADIDRLSFMDRFKFSATNGCLSFSPRSVVTTAFSVAEPVPLWEHCYRMEVRGVMTNHPYTGIVTVETGAGLKDSLGNASAEARRVLLLK